MKPILVLLITFYTRVYGVKNKRDGFTGNVIGGVKVPISMYPHVAQIFIKDQICGGSIISDRVILTAAHCLSTLKNRPANPKDMTVYLGSDYLERGVKYKACKVVRHAKYNGDDEKTFYFYDIGLILLSQNIKFGPLIRKVDIEHTDEFRNEKFTFTFAGFGVASNTYLSVPSKRLIAARMSFVNSETCNNSQSYRDFMEVPDHMFCMVGQGWISDCYGDSGSGIIWRRTLVGIVSTGRVEFCGSDSVPSMYTDAVYFRKWIMEKVMKLESKPIERCHRSTKIKKQQKNKRIDIV